MAVIDTVQKDIAYRIMVCWWKLMQYPMDELAKADSLYVGTLEEEVQNLEAAIEIMKRNGKL